MLYTNITMSNTKSSQKRMKELQSLIKNTAKDFLPVEVITEFIALIQPWEKKISSFFFQITGKEGPPKLEFGCHAGNVLVDITFSEKEKCTNVIPLTHVDRIQFKETGESIQFSIYCSNTMVLLYESSTHENKELLKEYAGALIPVIGG